MNSQVLVHWDEFISLNKQTTWFWALWSDLWRLFVVFASLVINLVLIRFCSFLATSCLSWNNLSLDFRMQPPPLTWQFPPNTWPPGHLATSSSHLIVSPQHLATSPPSLLSSLASSHNSSASSCSGSSCINAACLRFSCIFTRKRLYYKLNFWSFLRPPERLRSWANHASPNLSQPCIS